MHIGSRAGCHQKKSHSFVWHGKQFPICARCTGVLLGYIVGFASYYYFTLSFKFVVLFAMILLFDWTLQFLKILHSTNLRRLITGLLCGLGFGNMFMAVLSYISNLLFEFIYLVKTSFIKLISEGTNMQRILCTIALVAAIATVNALHSIFKKITGSSANDNKFKGKFIVCAIVWFLYIGLIGALMS